MTRTFEQRAKDADEIVLEEASTLFQVGDLTKIAHLMMHGNGVSDVTWKRWQRFMQAVERADAFANAEDPDGDEEDEDEAPDPFARDCERYHREVDDRLTGDAA